MANPTPKTNGENNEPPRIRQVQEAADSESRPRATPREEKKEKRGYECEFVEPPPKQLQSECSICLLVLREPHLISCCGHNFCETCIGRIQRDRKPCPLCNEPGFTTVANGGLKRSLNEFEVRCPHRELGCEWVGELGKLDQHLNTDPQPEHQLEGCQFTSIKCIHCKDHMRRHVIAGHQNERCPKRPYTCEYCEEYESTFEDVANHWAECKCYLLPCPNNCHPSGSGVERQNLEHHVKEECPLTVVECDFHYAGCGVKLPRKDMAVHMKEDSVAHISLLAAENQRLAKQLLEREEQLLSQQNITTQRLSHLEESTDQMISRSHREHKENLTQLQQSTAQRELELEENIQSMEQKLTRNRRELNENLAKVKEEIHSTRVVAAAVLILVISVAFGCSMYYCVPLHREHRDLVYNVTQHYQEHEDLVDRVTEHHQEHQDLVNVVTKHCQNLADRVTQLHQEHQDLVNMIAQKNLSDKVTQKILDDRVTQHHQEHQDLVNRVAQDFFQNIYGKLVPGNIKMCGFKDKGASTSPSYSASFYTHLFGYKMCLRVYANGYGEGEGTHVSVATVLMRGEFDSHLDWPLRGDITFQVLGQDDKKHRILFTNETPDDITSRVTDGERADKGWGIQQFIPHSELDSYLQDDDCLIFKILQFILL